MRPRARVRTHDDGVFILYAVLIGLIAGLLTGGSAARLGDLRFRWAPLIVVGMIGQVLLFSTPLGDALGPVAPAVYVASNLVVLVAVWRNLDLPGLALVLVGGCANLLAIVANGGYMPVSEAALVAMGRLPQEGYSNSRLVDGVAVWPLTDLFVMPAWVPEANVFSVGDVLIGIGAAIAVVAAMHGRGPLESRSAAASPGSTPGVRCARRTDPTGGSDRYFRRMAQWDGPPHRSESPSDVRSHGGTVQGKPDRETGTQSQGSSPEDRPVAGATAGPKTMRWYREGDPGALHCGVVAPGDHGPDPRRGSQVGLSMNLMFVVVVLSPRHDVARPGPQTGIRWD